MSASMSSHSKLRLTQLEDRLVPTTGGSISVFAFIDSNLNGRFDSIGHAGEPTIPGVQVYADMNNNGRLDSGEQFGDTPIQFNFASDGTYVIRSAELPGAPRTTPA